jgi:hypothetical protein
MTDAPNDTTEQEPAEGSPEAVDTEIERVQGPPAEEQVTD